MYDPVKCTIMKRWYLIFNRFSSHTQFPTQFFKIFSPIALIKCHFMKASFMYNEKKGGRGERSWGRGKRERENEYQFGVLYKLWFIGWRGCHSHPSFLLLGLLHPGMMTDSHQLPSMHVYWNEWKENGTDRHHLLYAKIHLFLHYFCRAQRHWGRKRWNRLLAGVLFYESVYF